jgi:Leucine-rich repeat (LRR) protein
LNWLANNTELDSYSNATRRQRFALASLYYATGGENWLDDWLLLPNRNGCQWASIRSSAGPRCITGQYYNLALNSNNLTVPLPDELAILTDLNHLSFAQNKLTGQIPSTLGLLTNLEDLSLAANYLSEKISSEIGLCTDLSFLNLAQNALTGPIPSTLGLLTNLGLFFALNHNDFSGTIPNAIGACTQLVFLDLSQIH